MTSGKGVASQRVWLPRGRGFGVWFESCSTAYLLGGGGEVIYLSVYFLF